MGRCNSCSGCCGAAGLVCWLVSCRVDLTVGVLVGCLFLKQKTAYESRLSLGGSERWIRDKSNPVRLIQ